MAAGRPVAELAAGSTRRTQRPARLLRARLIAAGSAARSLRTAFETPCGRVTAAPQPCRGSERPTAGRAARRYRSTDPDPMNDCCGDKEKARDGARRTLELHRPDLILAVTRRRDDDTILMLRSLGYSSYQITASRVRQQPACVSRCLGSEI